MNENNVVESIVQEIYRSFEQKAASKSGFSNADGSTVEYVMLEPNITLKEIQEKCETAARYKVRSVLLPQWYISSAKEYLYGKDIKICTPIGFADGTSCSEAKYYEIREAGKNGADEVEIALMLPAIKAGEYDKVAQDLSHLMFCVRKQNLSSRVILEAGYLNDDQIKKCIEIAQKEGVDMIALSYVMSGKTADVNDLKQIRKDFGRELLIKISGGIWDKAIYDEMVSQGASLVATSKIEDILK